MSIFRKRKPLVYLSHRIRKWFDLSLYDVTRVIAGSPRAYGIDISHWEGFFDPDQAYPGLIDFAIFKATEGTTWVDDFFELNYASAAGKVPVLGAYHYLRSGMDPRTQANHFIGVIENKKLDILVGDFESTNNTMDDEFVRRANIFGSEVKNRYPDAKVLFYTNPSTYDSVVYPGSVRLYGRDVFTEFPWDGLWIAQYYLSPSPSKNPSMPKTRSDWVLWQYSEAGDPKPHGTQGWVDQNVFNGRPVDLQSWLGSDAPLPPPADQVDFPYPGVRRTKGIRFGCQFQTLQITSMSIQSAGLVFPGTCETVENIYGDIVANVTGFTTPGCVPNQLLKINGTVLQGQHNTEPYFYWDDAKKLHFDHRSTTLDFLPNAAAIKRYLVMDGVQNPNPSPAWDEIHPWQLLGAGPGGETVLITVQSPGFNLYRASDLMREFGVLFGGDLDSGGSGQTKVGDEITRCTSEVRGVSNFFFIMIDSDPTTGEQMYQVKTPTTLHRFRQPAIKGEYGTLAAGTKLDSTEIFDKSWLILNYSPLPAKDNNPPYAVALADLELVDDTPPPPPPPAGDISYFKSFDENDNELDTWVRDV